MGFRSCGLTSSSEVTRQQNRTEDFDVLDTAPRQFSSKPTTRGWRILATNPENESGGT